MRHFCTYFDSHYLLRGLVLYQSLKRHAPEFTLWVLCFDEAVFDALTQLAWPGLQPIRLDDFERGDGALARVKPARSRVEYYFTCSPSLPLYLLDHQPQIDTLTYLDADLCVYDRLDPIWEELGQASVLILPHRFSAQLRDRERYGLYNVGWLTFRNDLAGRACLTWWRERCLEWCYDRVEGGKFADQKYLDDWPQRFANVAVLQNSAAGLAPWNWMNYRLMLEDHQLRVDGSPLIFYHFHGFKRFSRWLSDPNLSDYGGQMPSDLLRWLYGGYSEALHQTWLDVRATLPRMPPGYSSTASRNFGWRTFLKRLLTGRLLWRGVPV